MIRFDNVSVRYPTGTLGLESIDLEIEEGSFVVVVGLYVSFRKRDWL